MSRFSKIIKQVISAKYATRPSQDLIMCISCWTTTMSMFFPLESTYTLKLITEQLFLGLGKQKKRGLLFPIVLG